MPSAASRLLEDVTARTDIYFNGSSSQPEIGKQDKEEPNIIYLDESLMEMVYWVVSTVASPLVCLFGIVFNFINISVLVKMGFSHTNNISLLGLSLSDLGSLITLIWIGVCYTPLLKSDVLPFLPRDVAHLTGCWPHVMFCRVSGLITTFVAFERFLCIAFPLKVKQILTTRMVKRIICAIFFFTFASGVPLYYAHRLGLVYVKKLNISLLGLTYSHDRELMETFAIPLISVVPGTTAFCLTVIFTTGLLYKLNEKSNMRKKMTDSSSEANQEKLSALTSRDEKLARMMLVVSSIFIACFMPFIIICVVLTVFPQFGSWYGDIYLVAVMLSYFFEAINSSINIFIYYNMSSRYKEVFDKMWCHGKGEA